MSLLRLRQSFGPLELHHVAGRAFDEAQVPVCRNCHRTLSDWQKDHPTCVGASPNELERIGHALLGFALDKIGVDRWHYDLWHSIIQSALDGHADQVDLSYHSGLSKPAVSRYGATTPKLLGWFKQRNSGRDYGEQVKPFNFLIAFQSRQRLTEPDGEQWTPKRGRPRKPSPIRPVAPFSRNISEAAETAFDRETDKRVEPDSLITYAEALAQYHLRPEAKFLNGDFFDRGRTGRRHVIAEQILHIG